MGNRQNIQSVNKRPRHEEFFRAGSLQYCMEPVQEYYSVATAENISLAEASYNLFRPYMDTYQWAQDNPAYGPRTADIASAILNRGKPGSHTFHNQNGQKYTLKQIHPWVFEKAVKQRAKLYYVSGCHRALPYFDFDRHRPWQTSEDIEYASKLVSGIFDIIRPHGQYLFQMGSDRGSNAWLKVEIGNKFPTAANRIFQRLERAIRRHLAAHECWADFELKARMSHFNENGFDRKQYGKLPIHHPSWNFQKLEEFTNTEAIPVQMLDRLCDRIEEKIPASVLTDWEKIKSQRDEEYEGRLLAQLNGGFPDFADDELVPVTEQLEPLLSFEQMHMTLLRIVGNDTEPTRWLRVRHLRQKPQNNLISTEAPIVSSEDQHDSHNDSQAADYQLSRKPVSSRVLTNVAIDDLRQVADSFDRQSEALRRLARRLRRVPTLDESLEFIRVNQLYTGAWSQNWTGRQHRVGQILGFIARTFDPTKAQECRVEIGKYDKWVKAQYPNGIVVPEGPWKTRTGKIIPFRSSVRVSPEFISIFMDVVHFCLVEDENENGSFPQDRAEGLWKKLPVSTNFNNTKWKACREVFDRLQIVNVVDRHYEPDQAMKWKVGRFFPGMKLWKPKKRKGIHPAVLLTDFLSKKSNKRREEHNTLLEGQWLLIAIWAWLQRSRPPPPQFGR